MIQFDELKTFRDLLSIEPSHHKAPEELCDSGALDSDPPEHSDFKLRPHIITLLTPPS